MTLTVGSLFSGAAVLDMAVESVLDARTAWHAEIDPAACKVLAHRYPDVPNLGDVTGIDWAGVPPVDVICGGSPCQDVSHAGQRRGMRAGTRSGLWAAMCDAIDIIRPALVVWENVRGVLSAEADSAMEPCAGCVGDADDGAVLRALGRVVGDLASIGYVGRWHGLRAADVGAPHGRFRVFVVAWPAADTDLGGRERWAEADCGGRENRSGPRRAVARLGGHAAADAANVGHERCRPTRVRRAGPEDSGRTTPDALRVGRGGRTPEPQRRPEGRTAATGDRAHTTADATGDGRDEGRPEPARIVGRPDAAERGAVAPDADAGEPPVEEGIDATALVSAGARAGARDSARGDATGVDWGQYAPAIARWARILGRPAPAPTELAPRGGQRLSPRFVEWMMGWPDGWVTDVPGVSRNDALKICGNGVVPQQAAEALRRMLALEAVAA